MNAKRIKDMVGVLPKRRILMWHGESQGNQDTAHTPPHSTITFNQRHKAWPKPSASESTSAA